MAIMDLLRYQKSGDIMRAALSRELQYQESSKELQYQKSFNLLEKSSVHDKQDKFRTRSPAIQFLMSASDKTCLAHEKVSNAFHRFKFFQ